jgi:DUF971 family protein
MILSASSHQATLTRREIAGVAALLAVLILLINSASLVGNELAAAADGPRLNYPLQNHAWSMLARGELPTWSNNVGGGYPILSGPQAVMFYPPSWIFGLFRSPLGYNLVTLLHAWIAGLGAYVLARCFKASRVAALVAALIMIFGASIAARVAAGHIGELANRAWTPWQLAAIYFLAQRPTLRRGLALGVVFGLTLLTGASGYQVVMYNGIVSAVWGAYWLFKQKNQRQRVLFIGWCAAAIGLGAALSAVQTLPTAELLSQGNRQGRLSDADLNVAALPVPMVLGYALPLTFDDATIRDYIWPEFATYAGAATLFLAIYALRRRHKEAVVRILGAVALIFLLLSFGLQSPLFRLVLEVFPPYTLVRNPARHLSIVQLALAMLAALGLDTLLSQPLSAIKARWHLAGVALAALIVVVVATRPIESPNSWDVFPERLLRGAVWFVAALTAFLLSVRLARVPWPQPRAQQGAILLVVGVILLDLALYGHPLINGNESPGRLDYLTRAQFPNDYLVAFDENDSVEASNVLHAADQGVLILNLYTSILPQRMVRAANLLVGRPADTYLENHIELVNVARPDLLDMLAVRWLLFEPDQTAYDDASLRFVRDAGVVRVYENTNALPVVRLVPDVSAVPDADASIRWLEDFTGDFGTQAVIEGAVPTSCPASPAEPPAGDRVDGVTFSGGDIRVNAQTSGPRLLVVNQTYVKGWRAWVNGDSSTVYPTNQRWLGVYLACAGDYEIHLQFLPRSLQTGALISAITAAGMLLALAGEWVWRRRYA